MPQSVFDKIDTEKRTRRDTPDETSIPFKRFEPAFRVNESLHIDRAAMPNGPERLDVLLSRFPQDRIVNQLHCLNNAARPFGLSQALA